MMFKATARLFDTKHKVIAEHTAAHQLSNNNLTVRSFSSLARLLASAKELFARANTSNG
jgi:hypothetical protein